MSTDADAGRRARARIVWLDAPDLAWEPFAIPDGQPPVHRLVLQTTGPNGASVQAVRFPSGWTRPRTGHYDVDEEFVVVRGSLVVSGIAFDVGDHGFLPAGTPRHDSAAGRHGCLALAWFPRPPRWSRREAATGRQSRVVRIPISAARGPTPERERRGGHLRVAPAASDIPSPPRPHPLDVVSVAQAAWVWLPETADMPELSGPLLLHHWP